MHRSSVCTQVACAIYSEIATFWSAFLPHASLQLSLCLTTTKGSRIALAAWLQPIHSSAQSTSSEVQSAARSCLIEPINAARGFLKHASLPQLTVLVHSSQNFAGTLSRL